MINHFDKIFFIDDDEVCNFISESIANQVLPKSEKLFFTESPAALIELIRYRNEGIKQPDLILLDLYMPQKDGFDFLEELKILKISIPVIILTSSNAQDDHKKAKEYKVADIIVKPLNKGNFINVLEKLSVNQGKST